MKKSDEKFYQELRAHAGSLKDFKAYVNAHDPDFTDAEINMYYLDFKKVNENDLENVSGGGPGGGNWENTTSGKCPNCGNRMSVPTDTLYPRKCLKCGTKVNYKNIHHGC